MLDLIGEFRREPESAFLLLHCSSGSSAAWLPVMDHLSQDYRVLVPACWAMGAAHLGRAMRCSRRPESLGPSRLCWMLPADPCIWLDTPTAVRVALDAASMRTRPAGYPVSP